MAWTNWSWTWTTTSRKPEITVRRFFVDNECICFCEPIKGWSKTPKTYSCQLINKNCTHRERNWTDIEPKIMRISLFQCQNNWVLFVVVIYFEKKMERLNSGDWRIIFGTILRTLDIGLLKCGRARWQVAEATSEDFNIVLTRQDQKLFYLRALQGHSGRNPIDRSLQDNVIILDTFFEYIYHIGCAISVHSNTNSGFIARGQNSRRERQTVFFTSVDPLNKNTRILKRQTWKHRVLHNTCTKHGRNIKTRCIGSTSTLLKTKDKSSIKHDRTPSFFTKHSQLIVFRKLFGWKLKKSFLKKYMNHFECLRRLPWDMIGWRNWIQKLLDKRNFPIQANRTRTQIMIFLEIVVVGRDADHSAQCWTRLTSTSEYLDCHILWNKLITVVFVNSWRRSRTTLIDNLVNEIYNKTMPTTHEVRSPRKWSRTWAM